MVADTTGTNETFESHIVQPASPQMADKLVFNRTGRLAPAQRRIVVIAGVGALLLLLCPLTLLIQAAVLILTGNIPVATPGGLLFTVVGGFMLALMAILIFANVQMFMPDVLSREPVRYARGPLQVRASEGHRPEMPFSFVVDDYSFGPFVVPPDIQMRPGAPYIVYYSASSRLLLSIAALDAPDAAKWEPDF